MDKGLHCPHCGHDITEAAQEWYADKLRERAAVGGKAKTEKKLTAQRSNMAKLNASYTAEKRAVAAEKRRQTMAAKKAQKTSE